MCCMPLWKPHNQLFQSIWFEWDLFYFSLTQSGRSSLRSSTEEDYSDSSKNTSFATPRYTVLMLGSTDSGKTTLTSQFMSSNNMRGYINETIGKWHTCSLISDRHHSSMIFTLLVQNSGVFLESQKRTVNYYVKKFVKESQ